MIEVRVSSVHGRGVFATRAIRRGELIERSPVLVVPAAQLEHLDRTCLYDYYFAWGDDAGLALGLGSLMNHAVEPNADHELLLGDGAIVFTARRDIATGEEITIHYNNEPGDTSPLWFQT